MKIEVIIGNDKVEVDLTIFSHILNCHSLNLRDWARDERKKFTDFIGQEPDRDNAERNLCWLYDELEKIQSHRDVNTKMQQALKMVREEEATRAFLISSRLPDVRHDA